MMKKTLLLAKTLHKSGSGNIDDTASSYSYQTITAIVIGIILTVLMFIGGKYICRFSDMFGGKEIIFKSLFAISVMIMLFLSIPDMLNKLYMSDDLNILIPMPITARQIVLARCIDAASVEYICSAITVLSFSIGYMVEGGFSAGICIAAVLGFLLIPVTVICIASSVLIILLSVFRQIRNKDLIKILGVIAGVILFFAYFYIRNKADLSSDAINKTLTVSIGIFDKIAVIFPITILLAQTATGNLLLFGIASIAVSAVYFAIFILISDKLYLNSAINMQTTAQSSKKADADLLKRKSRAKGVIRSYTAKELKMVFRTPAFILYGWLLAWIWPLGVVVMLIFQNNSASIQLDTAESFLILTFFISVLISAMTAAFSNIASNAISREGSSFNIMKQIPVTYDKQLKAKRNAALFVDGIGSTLYIIIGCVAGIILKGMPIWIIPVALFFNITTLIISIDVQIMLDLKDPNIVWESQSEIAKRGKKNMITLPFGMILPIALIALAIFLMIRFEISMFITSSAFAIIWLAAAYVINKKMLNYGKKRINEI